jgi:hypothetical protein
MNQSDSDKRAQANRLNAQKSTGPRTPEGKQAVRLNALKHGLSARTIVLPGEDASEFQQLCDDLEARWQPQDRTELYFVEKMAIAQWQQARGYRREVWIVSHPEKYTSFREKELFRLVDLRQRLERVYSKCLAELRSLQKQRRLEQQEAEPTKQSQPEQPPDPPEAYMPGTYTRTPQAESEEQSHSKRPYVPNPADYLNTRDILRQVELEKEQERARKQAEERR